MADDPDVNMSSEVNQSEHAATNDNDNGDTPMEIRDRVASHSSQGAPSQQGTPSVAVPPTSSPSILGKRKTRTPGIHAGNLWPLEQRPRKRFCRSLQTPVSANLRPFFDFPPSSIRYEPNGVAMSLDRNVSEVAKHGENVASPNEVSDLASSLRVQGAGDIVVPVAGAIQDTANNGIVIEVPTSISQNDANQAEQTSRSADHASSFPSNTTSEKTEFYIAVGYIMGAIIELSESMKFAYPAI